jgi:hypothetical protein
VGRHLVAALFQKREELLKLAGVGGMHRDFEPIGCLHRHHQAVAIGIDCMVRFTFGCALGIRCERGRAKSRTAAIVVTGWRNIVLPLMLSSICRQRDEHTQRAASAATFMLFSEVDSVTTQSSAAFSDESPLNARYPGRNFKFTVRKKP